MRVSTRHEKNSTNITAAENFRNGEEVFSIKKKGARINEQVEFESSTPDTYRLVHIKDARISLQRWAIFTAVASTASNGCAVARMRVCVCFPFFWLARMVRIISWTPIQVDKIDHQSAESTKRSPFVVSQDLHLMSTLVN